MEVWGFESPRAYRENPQNSLARDQPVIRWTTAEDGVNPGAKSPRFKAHAMARLPLYSRENPSATGVHGLPVAER